jgi:REP element-mobilizing transposase RayT
MARLARGEVEAGIYHVYARGNRREAIFEDDTDHEKYLELLGRAVRRTKWRAMAYCLMGNHVHLLLETREPNLGAGMQWFHGCYAQAFNRRHCYVGRVFQERYQAKRIRDDSHLWTVVRYIARNPVEAGLCEEPDQWRWSSFRRLADQASLVGHAAAARVPDRFRWRVVAARAGGGQSPF